MQLVLGGRRRLALLFFFVISVLTLNSFRKNTFFVHSNANCNSVPLPPAPRSHGTAHFVLSLTRFEICMAIHRRQPSVFQYDISVLHYRLCYNIIIILCAQGRRVSDVVCTTAVTAAG